RFVLDEVAEVIAKAFGRTAIESGPERRLGHRHAAALGHALIVIGYTRDHVNVGVNIKRHGRNSWCRGLCRGPGKPARWQVVALSAGQATNLFSPDPLGKASETNGKAASRQECDALLQRISHAAIVLTRVECLGVPRSRDPGASPRSAEARRAGLPLAL